MANSIDSYILDYAAGRASFMLGEVFDSYAKDQPIERSVMTRHLAKLTAKGLLARIGKGVYAKSEKAVFSPELSAEAKEIVKSIKELFPVAKLCVYEGPWISPLLHHLASNQIIYIEVEKLAAESVFEQMKMDGRSVYFRPDEDMIYRYINLDDRAIFVKKLISESPTKKNDDIPVATLEKLLVDIYKDPDFYYLQGGEYRSIMSNARMLYSINTDRLFRYASRRSVKEEIMNIYNEAE